MEILEVQAQGRRRRLGVQRQAGKREPGGRLGSRDPGSAAPALLPPVSLLK